MALILLVVVLIAWAGATVLRCPPPVAAPTAFFCVTLVLYTFGCLGLLGLGFWIVLVSVSVLAVVGIVLRWRRSGIRQVLGWAAHPAIVVYVLMLGLYAVRSRACAFRAGTSSLTGDGWLRP